MSEVHEVNVEGAANVARAAARAGAERLVHCSSAVVYGRGARQQPVGENAGLDPHSQYARSKALGERVVRELACERLAVIVARITAVLGPRCTSWLPFFKSVADHRFRVIGSSDNWHHLADVSDITDGLVRCGTACGVEGRTYNLAGGESIRMRDLARLTAQELGIRDWRPKRLPGLPFELYLLLNEVIADRMLGMRLPRVEGVTFLMGDRVLDISRARDELGYTPKVSAREAIRRTAEWYRDQGLL